LEKHHFFKISGISRLTLKGLMVTSVTEIAQNILRLLKYTDMTIHWKGLEEHYFYEGTISFSIQSFSGKKINFLIFSLKKTLSPLIP
jgi:lysozyme family protein